MTDAAIVAVRGEVVREVEPELARFSVTVSARDKDRQTTLDRLSRRAAALRELLDGYGDVIEHRETSGMSIRPETKRRGEAIAAYTGRVTTTVTVHDFTALGELMLRLSDQDQTEIYGPWWSLRPDSPVYKDARHAAIGEAITRAREYAEALGARVVRLVSLSDPGLAQHEIPMAYGAPQMMRAAADGGVPELVLDPQRQTVHAQVEARFEISEPTALAD